MKVRARPNLSFLSINFSLHLNALERGCSNATFIITLHLAKVSVPAGLLRQDLEQHVWTHRELPRERPVMGGDQHD